MKQKPGQSNNISTINTQPHHDESSVNLTGLGGFENSNANANLGDDVDGGFDEVDDDGDRQFSGNIVSHDRNLFGELGGGGMGGGGMYGGMGGGIGSAFEDDNGMTALEMEMGAMEGEGNQTGMGKDKGITVKIFINFDEDDQNEKGLNLKSMFGVPADEKPYNLDVSIKKFSINL